MSRLTRLPTLRVAPEKSLTFTYRGRKQQGLSGDTLATALFANGVRIFSRSLKYHRPRGLYSMDGESANTYMAVDGEPNVCAETTPLREGMTVRPQNVKGSPEFDLMGFMDRFDWAMPAGFFYRMFHKPYALWPTFSRFIRRAAGTGVVRPEDSLAGRFDERYPTADVCVIGGGPAGIASAVAAAGAGCRTILLERRPWLGGCFDHRAAEYAPGVPLYTRARKLSDEAMGAGDRLRVLTGTRAVGVYGPGMVTAVQTGGPEAAFDERYLEIRTRSVVVATGCIERPLLFEHNERPGIMQPGCAQRLMRTYGLRPGEAAVFSVGHDLGLEIAADLADLGLSILAVADSRRDGQDPAWVEALADRKIPFYRGWVAAEAKGGKQVQGVTLKTVEGTVTKTFECDLIAASAGLTPVTGPLSLAGARLDYDLHTGWFLPVDIPEGIHAAGRLMGFHDPDAVEAAGRLAGLAAARDAGADVFDPLADAQARLDDLPGSPRGAKLVMAPVKGRKTFVCFDEDTTVKNVRQAFDMGFDAVELSKRFTAAGTGPGQGGIPGHNLPLILAQLHGDARVTARPSTVRPPLVPTLLAAYAGTAHDMVKRTPAHEAQAADGAVFRRVGVWRRARYFSKDLSAREEIATVRNALGIIDVSTLGKFRVFGPDSKKALDRVYVSDMREVREGRGRYSAMVNEDACLVDDGVVIRTGESDYYLTTSTGRAGMTAEWLRYHTRYDGWDFHIVNLTDAFGAINLAGPKAREILQKLTDADLSNSAFPFMGWRDLTLDGRIPARAFRLGFVGELSYELHLPASWMEAVWAMLLDAGRAYGIRPFGLEAQNTLRLEKGHVIIGQESEIRTTLHDLGLSFLWHRHKDGWTVGDEALRHTENQPDRLKLAGFEMGPGQRPPKDGSIIVDDDQSIIRGHVCTARRSVALGDKAIGLALVHESLAAEGSRLSIMEDNAGEARLEGTVVPTPFYDPEGERLKC